jgi:hypothetical protein
MEDWGSSLESSNTDDSSQPKPWLNPMPRLWGGMQGEIWILHAAWDKNRALREVFQVLDDPDNPLEQFLLKSGLDDKNKQKQLVTSVASVLTRYGNHLVEGDAIAMDYIKSILRSIYASKLVRTLNVCEIGENADELEKSERFLDIAMNANIVLVCGPVGNPATAAFLRKAKLSWFFPHKRDSAHSIRRNPQDNNPLKPVGKPPDNLIVDRGVFVRCSNPYNREKRMYAAMGAYGFGTQGAAALACTENAAAELISAPVEDSLQSLSVKFCGWISVWRGEIEDESPDSKNKLKAFLDPEVRFRLKYPHSANGEHRSVYKNQEDVDTTRDRLQSAIGEKVVYVGRSSVDTLMYTISLSVFVLVLAAVIWRVVNSSLPLSYAVLVPMTVFTGAVTARYLLALLRRPKEY